MCSFYFQCQEVVIPVYSCMRDRNLCNFVRSSILSMSFLFIIYSVIGCFGYLTFGPLVAHNIMKMYDASDPFVTVGVGALIIKMIVTYPILALCGRYVEFYFICVYYSVEKIIKSVFWNVVKLQNESWDSKIQKFFNLQMHLKLNQAV